MTCRKTVLMAGKTEPNKGMVGMVMKMIGCTIKPASMEGAFPHLLPSRPAGTANSTKDKEKNLSVMPAVLSFMPRCSTAYTVNWDSTPANPISIYFT
jgi:hypothetical protein